MAQPTFWERTKTSSKAGFDKVYTVVDKLGAPVNRLTNKIGSEAFWPTTLDKESEKAARILRSFCKDGYYGQQEEYVSDGPQGKQRVVLKIPTKVIQNCKGICIYSTMRTGFLVSGSGGAGVVMAKKPDGTWSDPSGIMMHTVSAGWLIGVDIYDCVLVLNTQKAVDAFQRLRWTLGGEVSAVAGPVGAGAILDSELHKRQAPIFTYIKSRGLYAGIQVDGTVVLERNDENERFYGEKLSSSEILQGKNRHSPYELKMLKATLRAAQGEQVDEADMPAGPPPGDFELETKEDEQIFGIPSEADDDPFGVRALEKEGLTINDASTHQPVTVEAFDFAPREKSPAYTAFHRKSISAVRVSTSPRGSDPDIRPGLSEPPSDASFRKVEADAPDAVPIHSPPLKRGPPPALPPRQAAPSVAASEEMMAPSVDSAALPAVAATALATSPEAPIKLEDNEVDEFQDTQEDPSDAVEAIRLDEDNPPVKTPVNTTESAPQESSASTDDEDGWQEQKNLKGDAAPGEAK